MTTHYIASGDLDISTSGTWDVYGTGVPVGYKIAVAGAGISSTTVNLHLHDVYIEYPANSPIFPEPMSISGATVNLYLHGNNNLTHRNVTGWYGCGIRCAYNAVLNVYSDEWGVLTVVGGKFGAGIGEILTNLPGFFNMYGGKLYVTGGSGTGIGAGAAIDGTITQKMQAITINGGYLFSRGGYNNGKRAHALLADSVTVNNQASIDTYSITQNSTPIAVSNITEWLNYAQQHNDYTAQIWWPMPPAAPTGFTKTGQTATSISLSWTPTANATSYNIYSGASLLGNFTGQSTSSGVVTGLYPSYNYTNLVVKAVNANGESGGSNVISSVITPPSAPVLSHSSTATSFTLYFPPSVAGSVGGSTVSIAYTVYKNGSTYWTQSDSTTLAISGLTANQNQGVFYVRASNSSGTVDSNSNTVWTLPTSPLNAIATAVTTNVITVQWDAAVSGASSYKVKVNGVEQSVTIIPA